jgi:putative SOS response-associated peptidase YedK
MQGFHKPDPEKRGVVILRPDQYDAWLHCPADEATDFSPRFPANQLTAIAVPPTSAIRQSDRPRPEKESLL